MSRSGYTDDCYDNWSQIRWRGAVASAVRGQRGQAFLKALLAALDALPEKRLISNDLFRDGEVCAIGALGRARGMDLDALDPEDYTSVANAFSIVPSLARETVWANDEGGAHCETPEQRFKRMRAWVIARIKE